MNKEENNALPRLTKSKKKFEEEIKERIEKGKELLNYEVIVTKKELTTYSFYGLEYKNIYDETTKEKFCSLYSKWREYNIDLLSCSFEIFENKYVLEYKNKVNKRFLSDIVEESKRDIKNQITVLESIIERLDLIPTKEEGKTNNEMKAINTNKIFIVHGHNETIKEKVARLLENLKLEPIILHEQTDKGMTIIEKFEQHSNDVNFAIILLTADDEGKAKKRKRL